MKKILFTLLFLFVFFAGYSQMYNNGGSVTVESGATLVIEGSYTSAGTASIEIDGTVQLKGDFINNGGSIGVGSTGRLTLNGISAQEITGSQPTTYYCALEVNNAAGVSLTNTAAPGRNQTCDSTLILTSGKVDLNNFNLTLSNEGVSGFGAGNYIIADSTGQLRAGVGASNYTFPVGAASSYNPVILNEAGTADTFGVLYKGSMPGGWTGTNHAVTGNWTVSEVTAGGANLTVTLQWNVGQEQASFTRTDCAVGVSADNGATVTWTASGAAAGTDPYNKSGTGFTTVGKFLVGDYFFEGIDLSLKLFLAGAYNSSTNQMTKTLNTLGKIPLNDPYSLGISVASIPTNAVDWIKIQFRDKTNHSTTLYTTAKFVDIDGKLIDLNGTYPAKYTGIPKDQYYIAMQHRNHFGIVSSSTADLAVGTPSYDFTTSQSQAWQNGSIITNSAMKQVDASPVTYGLFEGDANNDGQMQYEGGNPDRLTILNLVGVATPANIINPTYSACDINMDGQVQYEGGNPDRLTLLNVVGVATPANILTRHLP